MFYLNTETPEQLLDISKSDHRSKSSFSSSSNGDAGFNSPDTAASSGKGRKAGEKNVPNSSEVEIPISYQKPRPLRASREAPPDGNPEQIGKINTSSTIQNPPQNQKQKKS